MDTQSDKKKKKASGARAAKRIILCGLIVYICYLFIAQQFDLSRLSGEDKALDQKIAEAQRTQEELQEQTDKRCKDIDGLTAKKEQELLVV